MSREPGYQHSLEARQRMSDSRTGKKHSLETIEKIRRANTGRKHSEEAKIRMSYAKYGLKTGPLSEEHREKISDSLRRIVYTCPCGEEYTPVRRGNYHRWRKLCQCGRII